VYQDTEQPFEQRGQTDYAHPDYYQASPAPSAQPVQPLDPYAEYNAAPYYEAQQEQAYDNSPYVEPMQDYPATPYAEQMQEYRGPQQIEGYVSDPGAEQREAAKEGDAGEGKRKKGLAGIGGLLATIGGFLLKFKSLAFLLKFGWAGFSAIFSIAIYSVIFGWRFAVGLVALLFLHEMGHALMMKLKGIPVGGLIFIPMLGAAVMMQQMPQNARDEAEVGIAGPIAGALASSLCLVMAGQPGADPIWAPLAYFGFFINLFNLVPIVPFDGGRVLAAIDRRVWILGFLVLLGFQIWQWINGQFSIWLLFFVVIAATQLWSRNTTANTEQAKAYYDVPVMTRISLGVLYFGLAAVLVLGMTMSHRLIPGLTN
jgi:Zn-dependent protease